MHQTAEERSVRWHVLDLFSGIGGFSLGLERAGMTTVAFCEIDPFCREVLKKHWPDVPCYTDIRELTGEQVLADADMQRHSPQSEFREAGKAAHNGVGGKGENAIDLICGGYPCQPFSHAGKRRGHEDDRHLWPEMHRLVAELRPTWVIAENVAGHITMGLDQVLSDLESAGYSTGTFVIPACAVDAPHRRDRVWIVAHHDGQQRRTDSGKPNTGSDGRDDTVGGCEDVAHTGSNRSQERHAEHSEPSGQGQADTALPCGEDVADATSPRLSDNSGRQAHRECHGDRTACDGSCRSGGGNRWRPEPSVGRVAHGIPQRVDRLKGLGNAVVPAIPELIGRAIMERNVAL